MKTLGYHCDQSVHVHVSRLIFSKPTHVRGLESN